MAYDPSELGALLARIPPYPDRYHGRGVVIVAGGAYLLSAYIALRALRASGCDLPVQVWHLGVREFPAVFRPIFERHGATAVDALAVRERHPARNLAGWECKPYAIIHSPFEEVIFIDADNVVLYDPSVLFEHELYLHHGALFWPDFETQAPQYWTIKPGAWELFGLTPRHDVEIESGQMVINKRTSWAALCITMHLNENSDFYYPRLSHGDKDTYNFGWWLTGHDAFLIPKRPKLCDEMIRFQFGLDGEPLFQHGRKWVLPLDKNPSLPLYRLEDECFAWGREFEQEFERARTG